MSNLYPIVPRPPGVSLDQLGIYIDKLWRRLRADTNVTTETANYTAASDIHWIRMDTSGGNRTATIPLAKDNHSRRIGVIKTTSDANTVTPTASSGDTLNNNKVLRRQWESIIFVAVTQLTWDGLAISAGVVSGPTSSTDNAVARFDGTTGTLLQNSAFIVDDTGHVTSFGGQIKFPSTQVSSTDVNTLDDYEEGTFTVTLAGSTTAGTQTYDAQAGRYIKIGKRVDTDINLNLSAKDAATAGNLQVNGYPFTAVNISGYRAPQAVGQNRDFDLNVAGGYYQMAAQVAANTTKADLWELGDNVDSAQLTEADFANNSVLYLSGSYEATA